MNAPKLPLSSIIGMYGVRRSRRPTRPSTPPPEGVTSNDALKHPSSAAASFLSKRQSSHKIRDLYQYQALAYRVLF